MWNKGLSLRNKLRIYKSFIRPKWEYGGMFLYRNQNVWKKIHKIFHKAITSVASVRYSCNHRLLETCLGESLPITRCKQLWINWRSSMEDLPQVHPLKRLQHHNIRRTQHDIFHRFSSRISVSNWTKEMMKRFRKEVEQEDRTKYGKYDPREEMIRKNSKGIFVGVYSPKSYDVISFIVGSFIHKPITCRNCNQRAHLEHLLHISNGTCSGIYQTNLTKEYQEILSSWRRNQQLENTLKHIQEVKELYKQWS